jgi:hypothetical protein
MSTSAIITLCVIDMNNTWVIHVGTWYLYSNIRDEVNTIDAAYIKTQSFFCLRELAVMMYLTLDPCLNKDKGCPSTVRSITDNRTVRYHDNYSLVLRPAARPERDPFPPTNPADRDQWRVIPWIV